jgi:hypothetical protein
MPLPALHTNVLRWIIRLAPFVFALTGILGRSEEAADEFTRAVASYELTLPALEAYGATMTGVADWTVANPAKAAKMNKRTPKGPTSFRQSIAHVETEPVIAEQLKKNKLDGRDFVLIPMVVMQARIAALGEAQGHTFPADRINPKNTALVRAHEKRVGEIMTKVAADRVRAFGR